MATQRIDKPIAQRSFFEVILNDPLLELPIAWREIQVRDQQRWTRRYLLPLIKVLCVSLIWLVRLVKRICPIALSSEAALNRLSIWFVKRCVSPEAEEILYRHLALENALVHFVATNCGDDTIKSYYQRPVDPDELGDVEGMNATLLHDNIILNLLYDLGQSEKLRMDPLAFSKLDVKQLSTLDFNNLDIPEFVNTRPAHSRLINLDFESAIYITVFVLVLLLDEKTIESSINSLNLDDSLMRYLSMLTGDRRFEHWTNGPFVNYVRSPLDLGQALQKHINICEYAYTRLTRIKHYASELELSGAQQA
jgi:Family of unknown function (DUF6999)